MIDGEGGDSSTADPFAGFITGDGSEPGDAGEQHGETEAKQPEETLELTEEDQVGEGETDEQAEDRRRRSKPAHERISELTAKRREAERERDALRAEIEALKGGKQADQRESGDDAPKRPDPADFEFGEADPAYIEAVTDWKVDAKLRERDQKSAAEREQREMVGEIRALDTRWQENATKAVERYPDFNEVVMESAAAGEWPCPPLVAAAISNSDQGADIAYHLATHPEEAKELAELAGTDAAELFRRFGRMEARFEGRDAGRAQPRVTSAPEPPRHNTRGSGGKFDVGADTTDFAAFERKVNGKR